jgi:BirA family biotin operon repressor/biotin-[acetyl-CoA-carboxylase] ligase
MGDAFLDADQIRAASFIRHVEIHDTLGSTNDRAAELARETQIELPALVAARIQTAGRGRGSNRWWSAEGALTFSVLLEPAALGIGTTRWPQLSLATAVAVCDALSQEVEQVSSLGIKWPNDVMLDGGKVAGILIESPGGGVPAKDRLIIGIGINVNNSWRGAPCHLRPHGAVLCDTTGKQHHLEFLLIRTLASLQVRIAELAAENPRLPAMWQRLCWLTEQSVEGQDGARYIEGVCTGIDREGALQIENVFGTHRIVRGSVRLL